MTEFGRDVWCLDSLRTGLYVTGLQLVGQRAYHRLRTPRGMLRGAENEGSFGEDIEGWIGRLADPSGPAILKAKINAELLKDPAILKTDVDIAQTQTGASVVYEIAITCYTSEGPFDLVLAVSEVDIKLMHLGPTT